MANSNTLGKKTGKNQSLDQEIQKQAEPPKTGPAHSPGHKKLNLKSQFSEKTGDKTHPQDESALNNMSNSDRIFRNESPQRRVIPGASIEKKGQRDRE